MMHEHIHDDTEGAPRLFLANGVTTVRTAGSFQPYVDLNLRRWIREGRVPGPELFLSSPFLSERSENLMRDQFIVLRELVDEEDARRVVRYWASEGFDAIKVYRGTTAAMLRVVVDEARRHDLHVLGHRQNVSCLEAAEIGITSIEHGVPYCTADIRDAAGGRVDDPDNPAIRARIAALVGTA